MPWPSYTDFSEAIQNPKVCFEDQDLALGEVALMPRGLPLIYSGNFACVYKVSRGQTNYAVRCFTREVRDQQQRYGYLDEYLRESRPPVFVRFEYLGRGIRVKGAWYPAVKMSWVEGDRLDRFVENHVRSPDAMRDLAARWRGVLASLRGLGIAHNDLQHGNVIVQGEDSVRLVDYDGIFLPRFQGEPSPELGHKHYQHPERSSEDYYAGIDNFPALVIYVSLLALNSDPTLWTEFYDQENLIFKKEDFADSNNSQCFFQLKSSRDPTVAYLTARLEEFCTIPTHDVPDLETVLSSVPPRAPRAGTTLQPPPNPPGQGRTRPPTPPRQRPSRGQPNSPTPPRQRPSRGQPNSPTPPRQQPGQGQTRPPASPRQQPSHGQPTPQNPPRQQTASSQARPQSLPKPPSAPNRAPTVAYCGQCGRANPQELIYCGNHGCAAILQPGRRLCDRWHHPAPANAVYCPECGDKLGSRRTP